MYADEDGSTSDSEADNFNYSELEDDGSTTESDTFKFSELEYFNEEKAPAEENMTPRKAKEEIDAMIKERPRRLSENQKRRFFGLLAYYLDKTKMSYDKVKESIFGAYRNLISKLIKVSDNRYWYNGFYTKKRKKNQGGGYGLFCLYDLPVGYIIGVYSGKLYLEEPEWKGGDSRWAYLFSDYDKDGNVIYIDPTDEKGTPQYELAYVNEPSSDQTGNLFTYSEPSEDDGYPNIQFVTCKKIAANTELLLHYGSDYDRKGKYQPGKPCLSQPRTNGRFLYLWEHPIEFKREFNYPFYILKERHLEQKNNGKFTLVTTYTFDTNIKDSTQNRPFTVKLKSSVTNAIAIKFMSLANGKNSIYSECSMATRKIHREPFHRLHDGLLEADLLYSFISPLSAPIKNVRHSFAVREWERIVNTSHVVVSYFTFPEQSYFESILIPSQIEDE